LVISDNGCAIDWLPAIRLSQVGTVCGLYIATKDHSIFDGVVAAFGWSCNRLFISAVIGIFVTEI
jgi:hypothetical protein